MTATMERKAFGQSTFCIHAGANTVPVDRLALIGTPPSENGWVPIPHNSLLAESRTALRDRGYAVADEIHALYGESGERYFGMLSLRPERADADHAVVVGIRNSHDKSFAASFVLGSRVFVCDNLAFSGEVTATRKHTLNIMRDLPALINVAVSKLAALHTIQDDRFSAYKKQQLNRFDAHDIVIEALDKRVIGATMIPDILREYRTPSYPEHETTGYSVWRMHNAFTQVLKGRSLTALPNRTLGLTNILDNACSFDLTGQLAALDVDSTVSLN